MSCSPRPCSVPACYSRDCRPHHAPPRRCPFLSASCIPAPLPVCLSFLFRLDRRLALATRTVAGLGGAHLLGRQRWRPTSLDPEEKLKSICGSTQQAGRPLSKAETSHHCFAAPNRKGRVSLCQTQRDGKGSQGGCVSGASNLTLKRGRRRLS